MVPHAHQIQTQQVFAGDYVDAGVVVDLLVEVHPDQDVGVDRVVRPEDVPVAGLWVRLDTPAQLLGHFADDGVLGHCVMGQPLLETLIVIRFRLMLSFSILSILGRCS